MTRIYNKKGIPHKGWQCFNVYDLKSPIGKCGMCGNTIRYVHEVKHDEYNGILKVGSECSVNIVENYSTAKYIEDSIKQRPQKKESWINRGWKISKSNNPYKIEELSDGERIITIYKDKKIIGNYRYIITKKIISKSFDGEGYYEEEDEIKTFSDDSYNSIHNAKLAVFNKLHPENLNMLFN